MNRKSFVFLLILLTLTGLQSSPLMGLRADARGPARLSNTLGCVVRHRISAQQVRDSVQIPPCLQPLTGGWEFLGFYPILFRSNAYYSLQYPLPEKQHNEEAITGMEFWAWKMPSSSKKGMVKASPWAPGSENTCTCCWDQRQSSCHWLLWEQRYPVHRAIEPTATSWVS